MGKQYLLVLIITVFHEIIELFRKQFIMLKFVHLASRLLVSSAFYCVCVWAYEYNVWFGQQIELKH